MASIRFQFDEHVAGVIARELRKRGIDVVTTAEAGLVGASDVVQLATAAAASRVIVTYDDDFLALHQSGALHAGIAYCPDSRRPIGAILEHLILMYDVFEAEDMIGRVEYL